jgi:arylsulfatase A-like enzyme
MKHLILRRLLPALATRSTTYQYRLGAFLWAYLCVNYVLLLSHLFLQTLAFNSFIRTAPASILTLRYISSEILGIAIFSFPFALLVTALETKCRRWPTRLLQVIILNLPVFLYIASWAMFLTQNMFLDRESLRMAMHNPEQLIAHAVEQLGARLVFYLTLALCLSALPYILFRFLAPGWAHKPESRVRPYVALILVLVASVGQAIIPPLYTADALAQMKSDDDTRATLTVYLQRAHMTTLGPVTTFFRSFRSQPHIEGLQRHSDSEAVPRLARFESVAEWSRRTNPHDLSSFNVILLVVESLRPEVPTLISKGTEVMPHLASIRPLCAVFSNHYSQSSSSSYADIVPLSSQSPFRSETQHFYSSIHSYPRPRIYDLLKQFGYQTAIISSQDERWGGMHRYLESEHLDLFFHAGGARSTALYVEEQDGGFAAFSRFQRSGKIDDAETIGTAIEWIRSVKETPFFLYTNLQNSHFPYRVPKGGVRKFWPNIQYPNVGMNGMTPDMVPEMYGRYLDSLHYVDQQIGRLLKALREEDLLDDTFLVVTGDTGQAFLEHGYSNHAGPMYNEVIRTPCLISLPDRLAGHRGVYDFATSHINIAPTVLSLLNLPVYQGFQGSSLFRSGSFECPGVPHYMVVQTPLATQYGVVFQSHKLLYRPLIGEIELYDLKKDPEEKHNLYNRNHPIGRRLEALLRAHLTFQLDYYTGDSQVRHNFFPPGLPIPEDFQQGVVALHDSQLLPDTRGDMKAVSGPFRHISTRDADEVCTGLGR